jgi:hypothetical protein
MPQKIDGCLENSGHRTDNRHDHRIPPCDFIPTGGQAHDAENESDLTTAQTEQNDKDDVGVCERSIKSAQFDSTTERVLLVLVSAPAPWLTRNTFVIRPSWYGWRFAGEFILTVWHVRFPAKRFGLAAVQRNARLSEPPLNGRLALLA